MKSKTSKHFLCWAVLFYEKAMLRECLNAKSWGAMLGFPCDTIQTCANLVVGLESEAVGRCAVRPGTMQPWRAAGRHGHMQCAHSSASSASS